MSESAFPTGATRVWTVETVCLQGGNAVRLLSVELSIREAMGYAQRTCDENHSARLTANGFVICALPEQMSVRRLAA